MIKSQTEKELFLSEQEKKQKRTVILNKKLKMLINATKIPKIFLNIPFNYSLINDKKFIRGFSTNMLTNDTYTISNIENTNPNYIFNSSSNSHRTKIYQKKKIKIPEKLNEAKEEIDKKNSFCKKN